MKNKTIAEFLYSYTPCSSYQCAVKPEEIVFNANLQEFSQRVGYITALESGGKISPHEAFLKLQFLWERLTELSHQLGIEEDLAE
jgi:hypothetical protein